MTGARANAERLCPCGHPETDHEQVPTTGPFPHLRAPGCCKSCRMTLGCHEFMPRRTRRPADGQPRPQ